MNQVTPYDPETGEVIEHLSNDTSVVVALARAEIDQSIATAKAYPRNPVRAVRMIEQMVMLDEQSATECIYALPRGGKPIKGPSVRFAEIVASQYGNCHVASRVVAVDRIDKVVIAEGVFLDLETGFKRMAQVRRRITDKNGRLYNDDMITVTGNAAASIAMREAVLKGVPKAVWRRAYEAAERVVAGDVKTLAERREKAIAAFAHYGVKPEQLFQALEIQTLEEIDLDRISTLTAMFNAIRSGEVQVEDYFPAAGTKAAALPGKGAQPKSLADVANEGVGQKAEPSQSEAQPTPSAQAGAGEGEAPTTSQADQPAGEPTAAEPEADATDGDKTTEDDIADAEQRGRKAATAGRTRESAPKAIKGTPELHEAWLRGFDEEDAAANNAG